MIVVAAVVILVGPKGEVQHVNLDPETAARVKEVIEHRLVEVKPVHPKQ